MHCIEIAFSDEKLDSAGTGAKNDIIEDIGISGIEKVRFSELYYLEFPLETSKAREIAQNVFLDPIVQKFSVDGELFADYNFCIEVRFHPDVTDNLGMTAEEAIEDYTREKPQGHVHSARRYYITGNITREDAQTIASKLLANEVIETYKIITPPQGAKGDLNE